jgi:hypothetical protein
VEIKIIFRSRQKKLRQVQETFLSWQKPCTWREEDDKDAGENSAAQLLALTQRGKNHCLKNNIHTHTRFNKNKSESGVAPQSEMIVCV